MSVVYRAAVCMSGKKRVGRGWMADYATPYGVLPVLSVAGTPVEMGRQYGMLAGNMVKRNANRLVAIFESAGLPEVVVHNILDNVWSRMAPHTPDYYLEEMKGIAGGAQEAGWDLSVQDIYRITAATNFDLYKREERVFEYLDPEVVEALQNFPPQCTMFAVWGSRTADGKMYSMRNLDWMSQTGMHEDRLLTVYRPEGRIACVTMGYAGVVGSLAGMNERGITLSEVGAFSVREELDGAPWTLMGRRVLEESACLEDAVRIIEGAQHTIGYNYLIADGDPARYGTLDYTPRAAAFETNFACCETFFAEDPKEAAAVWVDGEGKEHAYGLPMSEAVMRADTAFGAQTRALQAADDGPGDPDNTGNPWGRDFSGSTYTTCHKPMHDMIKAYETGGEYVFPVRGTRVIEAGPPRKIGHEEAMNIAATVAHNTEMLEDNDWDVMSIVYSPTNGDFWLAFESRDDDGNWRNAPDSGYAQFNMHDLMAD